MKEQIYTIPINEAIEENCECPICFLQNKLEKESVEYALGPAMMEPDYRIISNEIGYCNKHYEMLLENKNKLSLALVLDTHLEELRKNFNKYEKNIQKSKSEKSGFIKKTATESIKIMSDKISENSCHCIICDKIDKTLKRYIEVFFHMWKTDSELQEKIKNSKGFCLPHFSLLLENSYKYLSNNDAYEFSNIIYELEKKELERLQEEVHHFTLKFDYRNKDMEWGNSQDAPKRVLEKLSGYVK